MKLTDRRAWSFAALCAVAALGLGAYYAWIRATRFAPGADTVAGALEQLPAAPSTAGGRATSDRSPRSAAPEDRGASASPTSTPTAPAPPPRRILFRHNAVDAHYGKLAMIDYPGHGPRRFVGNASCEAVHFAAGRGICLTADRGVFTTFAAEILDARFHTLFTLPLKGGPSRCRVSRNGKLAALTVFISGHSYASLDFSTQTLLLDTTTGQVLADLEEFAVTRDGRPFSSKDFNLWGVTFAPDSKSFYCTLSTNRQHFLVRGELAQRTARVIHENVECPSLSPDGKRIAYKKRLPTPGRIEWQLHILDLASGRETPLAEKRSADDQIEWLDDDNVLYALPQNEQSASTDVWRASVDGRRPPQVFLTAASSPAVIR